MTYIRSCEQGLTMRLNRYRVAAAALFVCILNCHVGSAAAQGELVQVKHDFSSDPHWEGLNNRVVCDNCPTIHQDFGWSATHRAGGDGGQIGGTIWRSRTPAYYAMKVGPFSFNDELSASGQIAVMPAKRIDG